MSETVEQSDPREGYKEVQFGPKTLVVPSDWSTERFGDIFHRRKESIDSIEDETVKYIGLTHLDSGQLDINGYNEDGRERSSSRVFREGDVLFGKLRPNLNKAAIAPFSGVCSSDIIPIYAEENARQQYLPYLMHSKIVRDRAVSTMEGTNLPRTSWSDLEKTLIPLPSRAEQCRIAEILSTVEENIQQTENILRHKQELRKGLVSELIRTGLDAHDPVSKRVGPKEYQIADGWELQEVRELSVDEKKAIRGGPSGTQLKGAKYGTDGAKVYGQEHVSARDFARGDKHLAEGEFVDFQSVEILPDDVLVTMMGTVGDSAVFPTKAEKGIMDSHLLRIRPDQQIIIPEFLSIMISESKIVEDQIHSLSHGLVMSGLNIGIVESLSIPVPPLQEQQEFVEILSSTSDSSDVEKNRLQALNELKRGLMQDLLTGKVRVNPD